MRRRKSPFGFLLLFLSRKRPRRLARPSKLQQSSISVIARVDAIPAGAKGRVSVRSRLCRRNLCESAGPTESAAGASVGPRARARGRRAITRIVYAGAPRGYLIRRARGSNLSGGGGRAGGGGGGGGGSSEGSVRSAAESPDARHPAEKRAVMSTDSARKRRIPRQLS